jgi:hypothetical protein
MITYKTRQDILPQPPFSQYSSFLLCECSPNSRPQSTALPPVWANTVGMGESALPVAAPALSQRGRHDLHGSNTEQRA